MIAGITWIDHAIVVVYLGAMLAYGARLARRRTTDDDYFLAGRKMPWFAVGLSVIASLLSSLTYMSEPGEVWKSGVTHVVGKMVAIPFEMLVVWLFCIPFMMKFGYTSAYEYLEDRFNLATRRLGVILFIAMVVMWMGFVVLVSAKALSQVTSIPLLLVLVSVGAVATLYTMMGGLRAVIWTDVVQVVLLVGGGLLTILYVAWSTGTWIGDWYAAAERQLVESAAPGALPVFSWDPTVRATVVTVAVNMFVWHLCTHTANQMTVQRYFSTTDVRAARRSFVTGSVAGVLINSMLVVVGLAVLYFYFGQGIGIDGGLDPETERDLIFPTFAVSRLPAGLGGAILAALLAAAMSSIDSGVNAIATVVCVEFKRPSNRPEVNHVRMARWITLVAGGVITMAAYALTFLPEQWGIVGAMPRTFNAITGPLGGIFLVGIFVPYVGARAVMIGAAAGLMTSLGLGYLQPIGQWLVQLGWLEQTPPAISFTWILPCATAMTIGLASVLGIVDRAPAKKRNAARV